MFFRIFVVLRIVLVCLKLVGIFRRGVRCWTTTSPSRSQVTAASSPSRWSSSTTCRHSPRFRDVNHNHIETLPNNDIKRYNFKVPVLNIVIKGSTIPIFTGKTGTYFRFANICHCQNRIGRIVSVVKRKLSNK